MIFDYQSFSWTFRRCEQFVWPNIYHKSSCEKFKLRYYNVLQFGLVKLLALKKLAEYQTLIIKGLAHCKYSLGSM